VNEVERSQLLAKVRASTESAKLNRDDGDYQDAIDELQGAIGLIEQSGWNGAPSDGMVDGENLIARHLADCFGMIGGNLRRLNRLDEALSYFDRGRELEEDERYGINSSYNMVNAITLPIEMGARTATEQRDALSKAMKALKFQTTQGKRRLDRWAWADRGQCSLLLRDLDEARDCYEKFRELAEKDSVASHVIVLTRLRTALRERDPEVSAHIQDGIVLLDRTAV
jgi:tetratricopeptide (TPR) repeat protein